jgi:prevent-host-death family protein
MSVAVVSVSTAKQRRLEPVRQVDEGGKRFLLARAGVPVSVLVPVAESEAWEETLAIREDPATIASQRRGLAAAAAGRTSVRAPDGRLVSADRANSRAVPKARPRRRK